MSRSASVLGIVPVAHTLVLPGCIRYRPQPLHEAAFWDRVQVRERAGVRVTAAALGPRESRETFGDDLARHGIQPVWLQIYRGRATTLRGIDCTARLDSGLPFVSTAELRSVSRPPH